MTQLTVVQADIAPRLAIHKGNRIFSNVLSKIRNSNDLLRVLGHYIYLNAPFAGGVANLAGEIAVRQNLFIDVTEPVHNLADRATHVAADIFYACIDEFYDRSTPRRGTHRTFAQATLKGLGQYFNVDDTTLNDLIHPTTDLLQDTQRICDGYALNHALDETALFRAIGFHAGSEILADEEFRILDAFLQANYPDTVLYLKNHEVAIGDSARPAYHWVKIHTSVEADHFQFAMQGANDALRYYAGTQPLATVKEQILDGFDQFAEVQTEFMQHLL